VALTFRKQKNTPRNICHEKCLGAGASAPPYGICYAGCGNVGEIAHHERHRNTRQLARNSRTAPYVFVTRFELRWRSNPLTPSAVCVLRFLRELFFSSKPGFGFYSHSAPDSTRQQPTAPDSTRQQPTAAERYPPPPYPSTLQPKRYQSSRGPPDCNQSAIRAPGALQTAARALPGPPMMRMMIMMMMMMMMMRMMLTQLGGVWVSANVSKNKNTK
jgi:hypothetical protein